VWNHWAVLFNRRGQTTHGGAGNVARPAYRVRREMPAAPPGFVQIVGVGGDEQRETSATQEFSLLCGYAKGNFYKDATLQAIHHQHSHVVNATGLTANASRSTILN